MVAIFFIRLVTECNRKGETNHEHQQSWEGLYWLSAPSATMKFLGSGYPGRIATGSRQFKFLHRNVMPGHSRDSSRVLEVVHVFRPLIATP